MLEEASPELVEMHPELLAHHVAEAGLTERAVNYWVRAGERALASYAYQEAIKERYRFLSFGDGMFIA